MEEIILEIVTLPSTCRVGWILGKMPLIIQISERTLEKRDITNGKYEIYLLNVTLDELLQCPEPKQTILLVYWTG
ncbi:hypothetical protein JCM17380_37470 [Desulfosporosinus burensis]